jgi:hypothetical protein
VLISFTGFGVFKFRQRWDPKVRATTTMKEILISSAIGIGVYMILYALEFSWNFVVISPVNLHTALTEENQRLTSALKRPPIDPREQRRLDLVQEKLVSLEPGSKKVFRYILDFGSVRYTDLQMASGLSERDVNVAIVRGKEFLDISSDGETISVKAEFSSALNSFVQSGEL